ncbi:RNA polymerase sigma factor [Pelagibacterium sp.]|uniref:RNA polymerase sigma factor n=1 Tax=Pelagibacterium sp. TaxID=1967288 RepID=UPI003A8DCF9D
MAERAGVDQVLGIDDTITRAAKGDRSAFAALIAQHYDFLYRTAYKWCGNREDAEDVAQDVCVKLATAIAGFDGRSAFTSWLYRIVLNAVRDRQRQGARRSRQVEALAHVSDAQMAPEQESATTQSQVWEAVRMLPERQRDAVLLVYGEDMSHAAAAVIMGVREATVSWYVHEAKKALKGLV